MFNWCATQDRKMSALCVSFSDLGRIPKLIATEWISLQNKSVGMIITNFDVRNCILNKVTHNIDRCNLLYIVSEFI